MSDIHPSAVVSPRAELGSGVTVGPFCHVAAGVTLGDGCVLHDRVSLHGPSSFGPGNLFYPAAVLGTAPQDLKYKGGPTRLEVGSDNTFRENVTVHRGTEVEAGVTRIGDHNLFMVGVHIAHDAVVGNHTIIANYVQIAGHACLEDCVNIGGVSAIHHFVTIGRYAYVGGLTPIRADVPPYMRVFGADGAVRGVNTVAMSRWGISDESIAAVKAAYRLLFGRRRDNAPGRTTEALRELETNGAMDDEHVAYLVTFIKRQMRDGVFGRARESARRDSEADRAHFYHTAAAGSGDGSAGTEARPTVDRGAANASGAGLRARESDQSRDREGATTPTTRDRAPATTPWIESDA